MTIKSKLNAGGFPVQNHNQGGLKIATKVKAGGVILTNHNQASR